MTHLEAQTTLHQHIGGSWHERQSMRLLWGAVGLLEDGLGRARVGFDEHFSQGESRHGLDEWGETGTRGGFLKWLVVQTEHKVAIAGVPHTLQTREFNVGRGDDLGPNEDQVGFDLGDVGVEETDDVGQNANRDAMGDRPGTEIQEF